jgi:8-oxo-dGTP pyrophosphatase MutT (NUDIX family)
MAGDLRARLVRALERDGRPSSDYDLNPDTVLPDGRKLRQASVLVPIVEMGGDARLILTKRAPTLKHHPGQIAFPGGKVDESDDGLVEAALREAEEEIGLPRAKVDALGCLPSHETITGFVATPVLGLISPDFQPRARDGEVAEVFSVPLDHVMERSNYTIQSRRWRGTRRHYFTVPWGPYYIWGATARMLRALADRMAQDVD